MIDASDILIDIYMIDSIQMEVGSSVGLVGVAGGCGWGWAGEEEVAHTVNAAATVAMGTCGFLSARQSCL